MTPKVSELPHSRNSPSGPGCGCTQPLPSVRTARSKAQIAAAPAEIAVTVRDSSGQAITVPTAVKLYKNGTPEVEHFLRKTQKAHKSLNQSGK